MANVNHLPTVITTVRVQEVCVSARARQLTSAMRGGTGVLESL